MFDTRERFWRRITPTFWASWQRLFCRKMSGDDDDHDQRLVDCRQTSMVPYNGAAEAVQILWGETN